MARRLWENLGTLLLALVLAILVWVVALNEENPIEERVLSQPVPVELAGKADDMILLESVADRTVVTIRAPRLVWSQLTSSQVHVTAALAGLSPGTHSVLLQARTDLAAARIVKLEPDAVTVRLERSDTREVPVDVELSGVPAPGYEAEPAMLSASFVTVSGPSSAVARVSNVAAHVALNGLRRDFQGQITLVPVDSNGSLVSGVTLTPETTQVTVAIAQKQGFREVAVKVVITGQVASGYQVTNITVAPSILTVASSDPRQVEQMPGFVETQQLDVSGASDDVVRRLPLQLPDGVTVVGEQVVLVQVNIAAIEYSLTVERVLEVRGLSPGLSSTASPETVDVLLLGPLTVLDGLALQDVRVVLNLEGLGPGTYQVTPQVEVLPEGLRAENVLPSQVEVTIVIGTPTPTLGPSPSETSGTPTPATATPSVGPTARPTSTPRPTATATPKPSATLSPSATP